MASRSLGVLTLDLVARIGGYTAGLDKAEKEAAKRAKAIEKVFDSAANAAGIALGAIGVAAAASFAAFNRGVEAAAKFQDLAEETGGSAAGLASIAVAGATAGVAMESIAAASIKLTKSLVGVDDESKAAGAALTALNIPIEEFKALSPEARIDALTKAFADFADGTEKTAVAVALFGKAGAEQLKVFKALEEQGGRTTILTEQQIKMADDYADKQAKLRAELGLYAAALATQAIPAINDFTKALAETAKAIFEVENEATKLGGNTSIQTFAEAAVKSFAFVIDAGQGVGRVFEYLGTFLGSVAAQGVLLAQGEFRKAIVVAEQAHDDLEEILNRPLFSERLNKAMAERKELEAAARRESRGFTPSRPRLRFDGAVKGSSDADKQAKKELDNFLKRQEAAIKEEQDLLAFRNKVLDDANADNLISIQDYFNERLKYQNDALMKEIGYYEKEIAALETFMATQKESERESTRGQIAGLLQKEEELVRRVGVTTYEVNRQKIRSEKEYRESLDELNAKLLEINGSLGAAASIRFDAQNSGLKALFTAEGNGEALKALGLLRQYTVAQADLSKLQQQFSLAQGDLQIAEERITIARERGTMGEIESLRASGRARQDAIAIMERQLALFEAINAAARTPEQQQAIERLKVQLEGLKAAVDPLADKFNTLFADSAGNAFADFVTGTKSASAAFKDFTNTIFNEISRMVAKDLAKSLFGSIFGGATGGGPGGFLAGIFGGGAGGFFSNLFGGGGGFGTGAAFGNLDFGGFFAEGGYLGAGKWGIAGENGAEIIKGPAQVVPSSQTLNRSNVNNIQVMVPPMTERRTASQIGTEVSRRLQQANFRNA